MTLQFGHGVEAVENHIVNALLVTLTKLQFGHGVEAVENAQPVDWAMDAQSLQFGHGVEAVENICYRTPAQSRPAHFNSATALKPWRTHYRRNPSVPCRYRLQFGHGVEAVENLLRSREDRFHESLLQFGHGVEAVENPVWLLDNFPVEFDFNSATALKPWRTRKAPCQVRKTSRTSIRPRR